MEVILDNYLITISIIVISFFTAMITSLAGAGGGTILLAYMLQFINPLVAIPIHGTVQLTSNIARVFLFRKYLVWKLIIPFCMFLPFGVYLGLTIFQNLDSQKIKFLIGAFIISTIVFQNLKKNKKVRIPKTFYYILGFFTGVMNMLVGVIAPILAIIIRNNLTKKEEIVGTLGFFGFTGNLIKIFGFMFIGFEFYEYLTLILLMIPSTILGSRVGQILLFKIDEKTFKVIFDAILFLLALRLLF